MRASLFLSQERAEMDEAVKNLAKQNVGTVDEFDGESHEIGTPFAWQTFSGFLRYEQQRMPAHIRFSVDSDFAPDRATRKSTNGMVQRLGQHPLKTTSTLQTTVGSTASKSEF